MFCPCLLGVVLVPYLEIDSLGSYTPRQTWWAFFLKTTPLYAYHRTSASDVIRLCYKTVLAFDQARSKRLGLPCNTVKTHSRRRTLPSILARIPGISDLHVRAIGRWSLAILSFYVTIRDQTLNDIQNKAISHAECHYYSNTAITVWLFCFIYKSHCNG